MDRTPLDLDLELQRHGAALHRLAFELVRDPAAAADAVQETWLHAARRAPRDQAQVGGWLVTVLRRVVARSRRGERRRTEREQAVAHEPVAADHAESAARTELGQRLLAAVHALEPAHRDAIWQRYFEGLPPRTIAARSGVPVATVKSRLQRGLQQLRERLGEGGESSDWRGALALAFGFEFEKGTAAAAAAAAWQGGLWMAAWTKLAAVAALAGVVAWLWISSTAQVAVETTTEVATRPAAVRNVDEQPPVERDLGAMAAAPPRSEDLRVATDAPPPGEAPGAVRGRVVAATTGEPLAGVVVTLTAGKVDVDGPDPSVTTAADGRFDFAVRSGARIGIRGRRPDRVTAGWQGQGFAGFVEEIGDLRMGVGRSLHGCVVDEAGGQIPAQTLIVIEGYGSAHTTPSGEFVVEEPVPLGPTQWSIPYGPFELVAPLTVVVSEHEPESVVLNVRRRAAVRGVVVDEAGRPVAGARINDQPGWGITATAEDGSFTLLQTRPRAGGSVTVFVAGPAGFAPHAPLENVPWGTDNLRIELLRVAPFVVEVVDDTGAPVEDFGIATLRAGAIPPSPGKVRLRGRHRGGRLEVDDVVPGATTLRVLPTDSGLAPSGLVPVTGDGPLRIELARRRALRVHVVQGDEPADRVEVRIVRERGPARPTAAANVPDPANAEHVSILASGVELVARVTTDARGRGVLLRDPDLSGCVAYLQRDGGSVRIVRDLAARIVDDELQLELPFAAQVTGRVLLGDYPARQVRLEIPEAGLTGGQAVTIAPDGTFAVGELQEGAYAFHVQLLLVRACTVLSQTVVIAGEAPVGLRFDLAPVVMARVRGSVTSDTPLPPLLEVDFLRRTDTGALQPVASSRIAADGTFAASDLLPGTYRVAYRATPHAVAIPAVQDTTFDIVGGQEKALELRHVPRRLAVRMVRSDGSPVLSERIMVRCGETTWPSWSLFAPQVDEVFVLDPAPSLPVEFRVWLEGSPWSTPVVMPPDRTEAEVTVVLPDPPR